MVNEKDIEGILNDLLKKDESAMIALLSLTVPTTQAVLKDYDVRFGSRSSDYPQLGIITIINKISRIAVKVDNLSLFHHWNPLILLILVLLIHVKRNLMLSHTTLIHRYAFAKQCEPQDKQF